MLQIIAGGKPSKYWLFDGISEYEKRLKKPFDIKWTFTDDVEATAHKLRKNHEFLIILDERGKNLSSPEFSQLLDQKYNASMSVILVIGGPYGFSRAFRAEADLLWSFSRLVFPHELMRLYLVEQIYRAQEIRSGGKYHHS